MPKHQTAPADSGRVAIINDRAQIEAVRDRIVDSLERLGYAPASAFAVRLAFEEAVSNAFKHGHRGMPAEAPVTIAFDVGPDQVTIEVEDLGPGFDPDAVPDPTLDENLESLSGRGLLLLRAYMTRVEYSPPGNRVRMVYRRPA